MDEYNRRYTSVEVEEPYREDDSVIYEDSDENESSSERRSDTEYTERIIRYHSPSKITIAGADQVDLYLSDGYYGYGYDTDYSNGSANVNFNINVGNGWGSPWYTGWYDPWFYSYSPWWTYSSRFYGPSWGFGWGWGGFYAGYYSPWYDPWYGPSWGWGGGYWGGHWGHHHHYYPGYYSTPSRHYSNGRSSYRDNRSYASGRGSGYTGGLFFLEKFRIDYKTFVFKFLEQWTCGIYP